jgi:hypothetical protein
VRSRVPHRARQAAARCPAEWRALFAEFPGPLHGRHRHVHSRALALHRRARGLVARMARPTCRLRSASASQWRNGEALFSFWKPPVAQ